MKTSISIFIFVLFVTSLTAQRGDNHIKLSHNITSQTKDVSDFSKLDISEDFKVFLQFSETKEEVVIEANENLHELINVEKNGKTLKISTNSYSYSYDSRNDKNGSAKEKLVAYITVKELTKVKADEDVIIEMQGKLYSDNLTISLNEDSEMSGDLEVQNLIVDLDEDSILDIKGSAEQMDVKATEDSIIKSYDFVVGDLKIYLDEDSKAKLTVNGEIDLRAKEDSYFKHKGNGKFIRKKLTGDSKIKSW